ncbi:hypothetical protein A9Q84_02990 [Halobacteriovorax marinus]|uniref:Uncharacterized protein n=1 Tax=Halobacteriovorax marinus TaxID=97084 RepID=A0A1Y5FIJ5_9BACT|nr:hypothetical protein A9Q84_02990 [Halobacteriovorax marinus]
MSFLRILFFYSLVLFKLIEFASAKNLIVEIKEDRSWNALAKEYKDHDLHHYRDIKNFEEDLIKWNKHIKTKSPKKGDQIYVIPPYSPFISWNFAEPLKNTSFFSSQFNLLGFYSASSSQNKELTSNGTSIKYKLNSPATLGLIARKVFRDSHSLSLSLYVSYISSTSVSGINESKSNPPIEIGSNIYHELSLPLMKGLHFYYGADFERFASANENDISLGKLSFNSNQLIYATLGTSLYLQKTFLKLSGSYSIYESNNISNNPFSGYKSIFYIGRKFGKNMTYSGLIKYHKLTKDAGSLSGIRFGLGIGYQFF